MTGLAIHEVRYSTADHVSRLLRRLDNDELCRVVEIGTALLADRLRMVSTATVRAVVADVAFQHGYTPADLIGQERHRAVCRARQHAYWAVRQAKPHLSYPQIGRFFGGRDHTTIMHGVAAHEERMAGEGGE